MSAEPWWVWRWDVRDASPFPPIVYERVTRWRRGLVTLYRFESPVDVEWRLYGPWNVSVGISLSKD